MTTPSALTAAFADVLAEVLADDPEVRAWHAARAAHREGEERQPTRERRAEFAQTISRAGRARR